MRPVSWKTLDKSRASTVSLLSESLRCYRIKKTGGVVALVSHLFLTPQLFSLLLNYIAGEQLFLARGFVWPFLRNIHLWWDGILWSRQ